MAEIEDVTDTELTELGVVLGLRKRLSKALVSRRTRGETSSIMQTTPSTLPPTTPRDDFEGSAEGGAEGVSEGSEQGGVQGGMHTSVQGAGAGRAAKDAAAEGAAAQPGDAAAAQPSDAAVAAASAAADGTREMARTHLQQKKKKAGGFMGSTLASVAAQKPALVFAGAGPGRAPLARGVAGVGGRGVGVGGRDAGVVGRSIGAGRGGRGRVGVGGVVRGQDCGGFSVEQMLRAAKRAQSKRESIEPKQAAVDDLDKKVAEAAAKEDKKVAEAAAARAATKAAKEEKAAAEVKVEATHRKYAAQSIAARYELERHHERQARVRIQKKMEAERTESAVNLATLRQVIQEAEGDHLQACLEHAEEMEAMVVKNSAETKKLQEQVEEMAHEMAASQTLMQIKHANELANISAVEAGHRKAAEAAFAQLAEAEAAKVLAEAAAKAAEKAREEADAKVAVAAKKIEANEAEYTEETDGPTPEMYWDDILGPEPQLVRDEKKGTTYLYMTLIGEGAHGSTRYAFNLGEAMPAERVQAIAACMNTARRTVARAKRLLDDIGIQLHSPYMCVVKNDKPLMYARHMHMHMHIARHAQWACAYFCACQPMITVHKRMHTCASTSPAFAHTQLCGA